MSNHDISSANGDTAQLHLSHSEKIRFGIGFALFSLLWMTAGTSGSGVLLPQRIDVMGIGTPEVVLGAMNSFCIVCERYIWNSFRYNAFSIW